MKFSRPIVMWGTAAVIILAAAGLIWPLFYTPVTRCSEKTLRTARSRIQLYKIGRTLDEFQISQFEDLWKVNDEECHRSSPVTERLVEYLRCVYYSGDYGRDLLTDVFAGSRDFEHVVKDPWGYEIRAEWWPDVIGEPLEQTRRLGNIVVWSVGENGIDERGGGDDITLSK